MKLGDLVRAFFKLVIVVGVAAIMLIYSGFANGLLARLDSLLYKTVENTTASMGVGQPPVSSVTRPVIYTYYPVILIIVIAIVVAAGALWLLRR